MEIRYFDHLNQISHLHIMYFHMFKSKQLYLIFLFISHNINNNNQLLEFIVMLIIVILFYKFHLLVI